MDKTQQTQLQNLQKSVSRLEKMVNTLLLRISALEKQNRSLKAKAHQQSLNISHLNGRIRE
jgi:peptidoglycan hydrolase CwlO-like protein